MTIKELITPILKQSIQEELESLKNPIFVFFGVEQYVDMSEFKDHIADKNTFGKNGNMELFDSNWFGRILTKLMGSQDYTIISFPQFGYLQIYLNVIPFADRIIIVKDSFRNLLPLDKTEYLKSGSCTDINEERPEGMPDYMADQFKIGNDYYYTTNLAIEDYATITIFDDKKELKQSSVTWGWPVIDAVNDQYSLDIFVNQCLKSGDFSKKALVKIFKKHPQDRHQKVVLQTLNALLLKFGGRLYEFNETAIEETFVPKAETLALFHKYWPGVKDFRKLRVYKNPDENKEVIEISQGLIVETIINEYKKAKRGETVKDLFLTAPTGAGKSLLFQLPAFYVSEHKDVTIVVSPLISLMKDQVAQILNERNFKRVQYINGDLSLIDRDRVIEDCKNGEIDILYMAPVLLLSYDLSFFIGERKLGLLVIDEAHLITTWGRDFRVDYWFLGQHINKIRKYKNYSFPMVAVTATAVYGGPNDMVFDSIASLDMKDPHLYIGEVRRDDISFLIDNHDKYPTQYEAEKEKETVELIKKFGEIGIKTIVYAPYTRHIERLQQRLASDGFPEVAVSYHGALSPALKDNAYARFRSNQSKIMISTKAFGMGVDISDIQLVYHHAPSGLLPDYIQEIGRGARRPDIHGYAALTYATEDQRYSRILHGMSSLKLYQLQEVLKKIYNLFIVGKKKRNMLVSVDDFAYIFDANDDIDQKVLTALMMIEKDYIAKYRFNVLIARPKKLFTKVYARTDTIGYTRLQNKYGRYCRVISQGRSVILSIDLDELWNHHFNNESFPNIKYKFYKGELFKVDNINIDPMVDVRFTLLKKYALVKTTLDILFKSLGQFFSSVTGGFFTKEKLQNCLLEVFQNRDISKRITDLILSHFSTIKTQGFEHDDVFLQRRNIGGEYQYRVLSAAYRGRFSALVRSFTHIFPDDSRTEANRFVTSKGNELVNYNLLGSILEIFEMATFESRGGDNPMLFIRINDPLRIRKDVDGGRYENILRSRTERRHETSRKLFDHFFLHTFNDKERWDFIEDYFLGESADNLLERYPGGERSHVDISAYLKLHANPSVTAIVDSDLRDQNANRFLPRDGESYDGDRLLTIDNKTLKVSEWITRDPVTFDKTRRKHGLIITQGYDVLISKLLNNHFEYFRDSQGLKLKIQFKGYDGYVMASVVYNNEPVKFYKWWKLKENRKKVTLTYTELIHLLLKVEDECPQCMLKEHRDMLNQKKK